MRRRFSEKTLIWPLRFLYLLAVVCGVALLVVDSPVPVPLPSHLTHATVEAAPLMLVGIAFLVWLAIDRPPIIDLLKQFFIALAFILWGVDLLMPPGPWATFIGAVVIAIYVFDLAWLMEGNLRKKFGVRAVASGCASPVYASAGICSCEGMPILSPDNEHPL